MSLPCLELRRVVSSSCYSCYSRTLVSWVRQLIGIMICHMPSADDKSFLAMVLVGSAVRHNVVNVPGKLVW